LALSFSGVRLTQLRYIINNELEAIIKLYFNYAKIRLNNTKLRDGKYILINTEFINEYKKYYNYAVIEQKLNSFPFVQKILSNMKTENRDYNKIIDDKKICIIIKQLIPDINQQFISMTKNNKNLKINNINLIQKKKMDKILMKYEKGKIDLEIKYQKEKNILLNKFKNQISSFKLFFDKNKNNERAKYLYNDNYKDNLNNSFDVKILNNKIEDDETNSSFII
jgi:hypothetical protein